MELKKLNINKIKESKYKLRFHTEKQGLDTLEKSIKENELILTSCKNIDFFYSKY